MDSGSVSVSPLTQLPPPPAVKQGHYVVVVVVVVLVFIVVVIVVVGQHIGSNVVEVLSGSIYL
jgi:hypothetical protein